MLRVAVLTVTAVVATLAGDRYVEEYAYSKVMTSCLGEEVYYTWRHLLLIAEKQCLREGVHLPDTFTLSHGPPEYEQLVDPTHTPAGDLRGVDTQAPGQVKQGHYRSTPQTTKRQKREAALYDAHFLRYMMDVVKAKISNFTCVLRKINYLDDAFNLNYTYMREETLSANMPDQLKNDIADIVNKCRRYTMCLLSENESPVPIKLQEVLAFISCEKKARMAVCMKHDIKRFLGGFELSAFPNFSQNEDEAAKKLLHILWGVDAEFSLI